MAKWKLEVYFLARKIVEVEADNWYEANDKGLELVEEPNKEDFWVEEVECYKIQEGEE